MAKTDTNADDWWDCPVCGADTLIPDHDGGPDRKCTECDWQVTIPRRTD